VTNQRRRRGPEADFETAYRLAEIVGKVATSESWRTKLDDVCEALDEQEIPYPKNWSREGYRGWLACAVGRRDLAMKVIGYRLRQAKKRPQASS
jgi:hypothetical protein